jgi:elongation factor Ts
MTEISTELVRRLFLQTDATVLECKSALEASEGDISGAIDVLIQRGIIPEYRRLGHFGPGRHFLMKSKENLLVIAEVEVSPRHRYLESPIEKLIKITGDELLKHPFIYLEEFLKRSYSYNPSFSIDAIFDENFEATGISVKLNWVHYEEIPPNCSCEYEDPYYMGHGAFSIIEGSEKEQSLALNIAHHVTIYDPIYISKENIPIEVINNKIESWKKEDPMIATHTISKKLDEFYIQSCLYEQPYIYDEKLTIGELLEKHSLKIEKKLKVVKFKRWVIDTTNFYIPTENLPFYT